MKIIAASFFKCGTKTLHKCFETLGYSVCDFDSNFKDHEQEWTKIFTRGSTTEQFKKMYENVDAVCDLPSAYYWEEILRAFPDSKIILTMRKNEDDWAKSWNKQVEVLESNLTFVLCGVLTPSGRRFFSYLRKMGRIVYSCPPQSPFTYMTQPNEEIKKRRYRDHNLAVLTRAPKDRLLVLKFSDGWKPLCDFLGKDVPDAPFPHENPGGVISAKMMEFPLFANMKRELYVSLSCIFAVVGLLVYLLMSLT